MSSRSVSVSHAWVEERLSDYVDNQLDAGERDQLEQHLNKCAGCRMSLTSLRWSLSLVKQAPAPALPRAFVIRAPAPARRASFGFNFGTLRLATVVATLLLFALVATDFVTNFGGASAPALMRAPAADQFVAPTRAALAPKSAEQQSKEAAPPQPPLPAALPPVAATSAPKPTAAPAATQAPAPTTAPTRVPQTESVLGLGAGPLGTSTPSSENSKSAATSTPVVRAPVSASVVTSTLSVTRAIAPSPSPSPSPTLVPPTLAPTATPLPTRTLIAQAQPTRVPEPPMPASSPQTFITPLRIAEIGLFFFTVFFATLMVLLWRRK